LPLGVSLALYKDSGRADSIPLRVSDTYASEMGRVVLTATVGASMCFAVLEGSALSGDGGELGCRMVAHGCWADPRTVLCFVPFSCAVVKYGFLV
jgi:hypothetical protein